MKPTSTLLQVGCLTLGGMLLVSSGAVADPPASTITGTSITQVTVARYNVASNISSTAYVNLPGASTTVNVPAGTKAILRANFSGESACYNGAFTDFCSVRIVVNNQEIRPIATSGPYFDSVGDTGTNFADYIETHGIERSSNVLNPGNYTIQVQQKVSASGMSFYLNNWHLTVERIKV
jgi:hypothetical protein